MVFVTSSKYLNKRLTNTKYNEWAFKKCLSFKPLPTFQDQAGSKPRHSDFGLHLNFSLLTLTELVLVIVKKTEPSANEIG